MILGPLLVKKASEKINYYKLLLWMSGNMAVCMILSGFLMNHLDPWIVPIVSGTLSMMVIFILGRKENTIDLDE